MLRAANSTPSEMLMRISRLRKIGKQGHNDSSGSAIEITKPADRKSAGQPAVQILYKGSPECSKTPQNALLQPLSHNNIRKTGSIRNRQVTSSTLVVGSIFPSTCVLPSLYGQSIVTWIVT